MGPVSTYIHVLPAHCDCPDRAHNRAPVPLAHGRPRLPVPPCNKPGRLPSRLPECTAHINLITLERDRFNPIYEDPTAYPAAERMPRPAVPPGDIPRLHPTCPVKRASNIYITAVDCNSLDVRRYSADPTP